MNDIQRFLLMSLYLESQSSWDFRADYNFAVKTGSDLADLIKDAINSDAPAPLVLNVWDTMWRKTITRKRLSQLNKLVKAGLVRSGWVGLGEGSVNQYGASRIKAYSLTDRGRQFAEAVEGFRP